MAYQPLHKMDLPLYRWVQAHKNEIETAIRFEVGCACAINMMYTSLEQNGYNAIAYDMLMIAVDEFKAYLSDR